MSDIDKAELLTRVSAAVQAKIAYWDEMLALEKFLGFDSEFNPIPDRASDILVDQIDTMAAACESPNWIGEEEVYTLVKAVRRG